jgi:hypothetical protein
MVGRREGLAHDPNHGREVERPGHQANVLLSRETAPVGIQHVAIQEDGSSGRLGSDLVASS